MDGIPPDLAAKVVAADTRNAVVDVGEKKKLTVAMRQEMKLAAMTPSLAEQARALALLDRYCNGEDLTAAQWEEIRRTHPGFANAPTPPSAEPPPRSAIATPGAEGLVLTAEPSKKGKLSMKEAAAYALKYKGTEKAWRTMYRWIETGDAKKDPCPLAEPAKMPGWWSRCMTHRCPPEIEQAAVDAAQALAESGGGASASSPTMPDLGATAQIPVPKAPMVQTTPPLDASKIIRLEDFDPEEGDRLREIKQLQAAKFADLKSSLARGEDTTVKEGKYMKLCETIDKMETRITERMKKRGLYLLREEVESDLARVSEMLRQFRDSMQRRVLERCPSLSAEQRVEVANAILSARMAEDRILAKLITKTADDDLLADLRAAA